jgi:hypothetical protein
MIYDTNKIKYLIFSRFHNKNISLAFKKLNKLVRKIRKIKYYAVNN